METEIEAKFLDIDPERLRKKLKTLGAKLIHPERMMTRRTYDTPDKRLREVKGWVRVRNEGGKTTLSYKQLNDRTLHGTKEVTVVVDDFEKTCKFLTAIGLVQKAYQETRRGKWMLGDVEVTIDTWPWIPAFVELEGESEKALKKAAKDLGFDWKDAMHGSVETAYQKYYDVTEEEIDGWKKITFSPIPDWLEKKKKQ
ncbi:MAG: class IV adenylate cyclase [bacterium]|nr:class IV adenylate cyclase [bacterium]